MKLKLYVIHEQLTFYAGSVWHLGKIWTEMRTVLQFWGYYYEYQYTRMTARMVTVTKTTPKATSAPMTAAERAFQSWGTRLRNSER